jgi:peptide/nickel transport system substrate-binding protein
MYRGWLWYEVRPMAFNKRVVGATEHYAEMPTLIFNLPVYNEVEKWDVK